MKDKGDTQKLFFFCILNVPELNDKYKPAFYCF